MAATAARHAHNHSTPLDSEPAARFRDRELGRLRGYLMGRATTPLAALPPCGVADQNGKEIPSRNGMSRTDSATSSGAGGRLDRDGNGAAARGNKAEEETYGIETVNCMELEGGREGGENDRATPTWTDALGIVQQPC